MFCSKNYIVQFSYVKQHLLVKYIKELVLSRLFLIIKASKFYCNQSGGKPRHLKKCVEIQKKKKSIKIYTCIGKWKAIFINPVKIGSTKSENNLIFIPTTFEAVSKLICLYQKMFKQ